MHNRCALCGRLTLRPAVMIGPLPVGPTCARRAGLLPLAFRKSGQVFLVPGGRAPVKSLAVRDSDTLDLFEGAA